MKHRTATMAALTAATLGLGLATASGAVAHPGGHGDGGNGPAAAQGDAAQQGPAARAGRRGARGARGIGRRGGALGQCEIATDQLLTAENNTRLERVKERLDGRVADGDMSQERADRIFAHRQKMVTIKVERRTAALQPVLSLLGVATKAELRTAVKDAGGMRALLESKSIEVDAFREARRDGRQAARAAVEELCSTGAPQAPEAQTAEPSL